MIEFLEKLALSFLALCGLYLGAKLITRAVLRAIKEDKEEK